MGMGKLISGLAVTGAALFVVGCATAQSPEKETRGQVLFTTGECSDFGAGWVPLLNSTGKYLRVTPVDKKAGDTGGSNKETNKIELANLPSLDINGVRKAFDAAGDNPRGSTQGLYQDTNSEPGEHFPLHVNETGQNLVFEPAYIALNACTHLKRP